MNNSKAFYLSKTYWVNLILACAFLIPEKYRGFAVSPEVQALVFTGINFILRALTKDRVTLK